MQNIKKRTLEKSKINWTVCFTAFLILAALFFAMTEAFPRHVRLAPALLNFLNQMAGFKFFSRRFFFFFSDLCILTAFLALLKAGFFKKNEFFKKEGAFFLYALSFLVFLSLFFSPFSFTYFQLFMAVNFFMSAVYYSLMVSLQDKIYTALPIIFAGVLAMALFQGAIGIWQYFSQHSVGLRFLYEPRFSPGNFNVATLSSKGGSLWLFDYSANASCPSQEIARAVGTLPHANNFGAFMFFSILANLYFFFFAKKALVKKILAVLLFFQVFALFLSFSRAAVFALALSFGFFMLYSFWKKAANLKQIVKAAVLLFLAASLSFGLLFFQYKQRGGVISYEGGVEVSDNRRLYYHDVSWQILKKYPLSGIGFFGYEKHHPYFISPEIQDKYIDKNIGGVVHNIYLLIASEEGLLALFCFLAFLGFLAWRFFSQPYSLEKTLVFSFLLGIMFIGLCDFPYMYMPQGRLFFFLIPAIFSAFNAASLKKAASSAAV